MADNYDVPRSLIEQITDELASRLKDKDGFDADLIEKIKELADSGELKKRPKLVSLLKPEGEGNETARA